MPQNQRRQQLTKLRSVLDYMRMHNIHLFVIKFLLFVFCLCYAHSILLISIQVCRVSKSKINFQNKTN